MPPSLAHLEWGAAAIEDAGSQVDVIVIVDVLSFSTAVDVAVSAGATVRPSPWRERGDARPGEVAAVARHLRDREHPWTLSPSTLAAIRSGTRLVLPSPNGAALSVLASAAGVRVLAGCLRNASAVGAAIEGRRALVVAAGERWTAADGPLRPALEDLLGAGAILAARRGPRTPEAEAAVAAFTDAAPDIEDRLLRCRSGRELVAGGWSDDVRVAAEIHCSRAVPELRGAAYEDANG